MSIKQLQDIHFRDPFILAEPDNRKYYLYGSIGQNVWEGKAIGFDVYESEDLVQWKGPFSAFRPSPDFWSDRHFWAPEVYFWKGKYYMFASFKAEGIPRVTGVLAADSPTGPFEPWCNSLTPLDWECLDGTLFIDSEGVPWMVFCREWLQIQVGEMYAVRLQPDLLAANGEPILLFRASEAAWSAGMGDSKASYVTDGPFLYRMPGGELIMLWSTHGKEGYTMGIARSSSGTIAGPWKQDPQPLFAKDGGHGMLFTTFEGQLCLTIHTPNIHPKERPIIFKVKQQDGRLQIVEEDK